MRFLSVAALVGGVLVVGPAVAADMRMPTKAPIAPMATTYNWNGFYVGGHVGYGWGRANSDTFDAAGALTATTERKTDGVFGGGQIGVNWQFHPNWLIGVEADLSGSNIKGSLTSCTVTGCASSNGTNDWFGTVRGRLGVVYNNWLFYGTGGGAWMDNSVSRTITCVGAACPTTTTASVLVGQVSTASSTLNGWTVGGGIEWGFAPGWTAKLEYQHMEFNYTAEFNYTLATAFRRSVTDLHVDTVRVGVNYLFNWGGGPIVARY